MVAIFAEFRRSTLQIMPPLIIDEDEVDEVLDALDVSLGEVGRTLNLA